MAAWARENAAELRELAGQISGLQDDDAAGAVSREALHAALGDNDAAALVAPLTAAGTTLRSGHPGLADQVSAIHERTTKIRSEDEDRRNPTRRKRNPHRSSGS